MNDKEEKFVPINYLNENDLKNFLPTDIIDDIDPYANTGENTRLNKNLQTTIFNKPNPRQENLGPNDYHFILPNKHKSENNLGYIQHSGNFLGSPMIHPVYNQIYNNAPVSVNHLNNSPNFYSGNQNGMGQQQNNLFNQNQNNNSYFLQNNSLNKGFNSQLQKSKTYGMENSFNHVPLSYSNSHNSTKGGFNPGNGAFSELKSFNFGNVSNFNNNNNLGLNSIYNFNTPSYSPGAGLNSQQFNNSNKKPSKVSFDMNSNITMKSSMMNSTSSNQNPNYSQNDDISFANRLRPKKYQSADQVSYDQNQSKKTLNSCFDSLSLDRSYNEEFPDFQQILSSLDTSLVNYVRSQKGSRNLQKVLDKVSPDELDLILKELGNNLHELMVDQYSNYLCQKLAQCCSSEQRIFFLKKLQSEFVNISCNKKGTYALQGILDIVNLKEEEFIINESIKNDILKLSLDNFGTHVIQKILNCFEEKQRETINNEIIKHFMTLVMDTNGICIIKAFISSNFDQEIRKRIIDILVKNGLEIVQNPYGNYAIQEAFEKWGYEECSEIVKLIHDNIISLSMQKYSSNVVEKTFDIPDQKVRNNLLLDFIMNSKITSVMKNKFGNFVFQRAVKNIKANETLKNSVKEALNKKLINCNPKENARITEILKLLVN